LTTSEPVAGNHKDLCDIEVQFEVVTGILELADICVSALFACNTNMDREVPSSVQEKPFEKPEASYDPEAKLEELGIELGTPSVPVANYVNAVRVGNLIFLSGKGPLKDDGGNITGKIGVDLTIEEGYEAARVTGINQLAVLKAELGNLNKVKRCVKVLGMVNTTPDFTDQPKVINGYSDLMVAHLAQRAYEKSDELYPCQN